MFTPRIASEWRGLWKLTYCLGIFSTIEKVVSLVQFVSCASVATVFEQDFELHHAVACHALKCYNIMQSLIQMGIGSGQTLPSYIYPDRTKYCGV